MMGLTYFRYFQNMGGIGIEGAEVVIAATVVQYRYRPYIEAGEWSCIMDLIPL